MTLILKVDALPGDNLEDAMVEMLRVAKLTGCMIQLYANDSVFYVHPDEAESEVRKAFYELYTLGKSKYVQVGGTVVKRRSP